MPKLKSTTKLTHLLAMNHILVGFFYIHLSETTPRQTASVVFVPREHSINICKRKSVLQTSYLCSLPKPRENDGKG